MVLVLCVYVCVYVCVCVIKMPLSASQLCVHTPGCNYTTKCVYVRVFLCVRQIFWRGRKLLFSSSQYLSLSQ